MKRKGMSILAVIMMVFTFAASSNVSANQGKSVSTPAATQATKSTPKVAEPNPSWQDQYPDYYKVRMASATDGWIVGAEGAIRRYAGGQWVAYASPVTTTLRSVYPISNTAFAVGDNNVILQFIGDAWQTTAAPAGCANFRDVWMRSPTDGWAVGDTCEITPTGVIAHYNGTSWQDVSVPYPLPQMNALQMLSSNEGWFVGNDAALLHYLNGTWQAYNAGITSNIYSIAMLPDGSEGWAGTDGLYATPENTYQAATIRYSNGTWGTTKETNPGIGYRKPESCDCTTYEIKAYGVSALSEIDRWVVGSSHDYSPFYLFVHYSGIHAAGGPLMPGGSNGPNNWGVLDDRSQSHNADPLYSIAMIAPDNVWAVGASGYIEHWDGTDWTAELGAPHTFNSLAYNATRGELYSIGHTYAMISSNDNITSQIAASDPAGSTVFSCTIMGPWWRSIAATNTTELDAWAVGIGSNIFTLPGGFAAHVTSSGCQVDRVSQEGLSSVVEVSPTQVVASGQAGTVDVYTGTWATLTLGNRDFRGIAYSDGSYWTVGVSGSIYTAVGDPANQANWQSIAAQQGDELYAVAAVSANEAWAVGNNVRYHIVANTATREDSSHQLRAVYMSSPTNGWATGRDGAIEHYDGNSWQTVMQGQPPLDSILATPNGQIWAGGNGIDSYSNETGETVAYDYIPGHLLHYAPACYDYYSDVPASYYARRYILDLSCRGIVSGMGNHIYAPDANTTRIQFAKIISLARGWQLITPTTPTFSDVPTSNPLYSFVETAYANNALSGASPATCQARGLANPCFLPNDAISRAQAVIITVRAFGWPTNTSGGPHFSDVLVGSYAYEAVETAYNRGVFNGIGNGTFGPGFNVSRAQIAKIVDLALASQ